MRDACYKIRDHNKRRQLEWKGVLKATQNMGKGSHKVFKTVVKEILQDSSPQGKTGSEVTYFIPKPRNFAEATKCLEDIKNLAKGNSKGD